MVKSRKGFLLSVMMLIAAICMLFAACGGGDKAKLNFNTNGGPEIESVEVTLGEAYELPEPTWEGYSFEGWYLESDFSGSPVTSVTPEKDMTFYAKWEQMYAIKLELGGGTLEAGTTLYAKEGTNISDFMQQYVPTFSDHQFGEWLTGGVPLSAGATLTKEGVTLTAHYKIAYSVELYLQKLDLSGYEKAAENYIGYEYVTGTAFTAAPALEGFTAIDHDGSVMTKTLTENASENTFVRYFDRNQIALVLNANYPDLQGEGNTESETVSFLYGSEVTLPVPFSYRGYGLIGWSTTADGKAEYNSDFISSRLFNGAAETEVFKVQKPMTLYAVWLQGYSNMFGGSDYIFHFAEDAEEIYLLRGDKMFLGTFDPETSEFDFFSTDAAGEEVNMLQGKLYTDGTFSYYSDARDGFTFTYMKNLVGADENYKIHLDGYNGLEYTDATNPHNTSKGTYTINADGFYDVEYTEGPMAGQSFVYALSRSSSGAYFLVRDEEEYGWGAIPRGVIYQGHLTYYTSVYAITLNGFGNATFANPDGSTTSYYYRHAVGVQAR